MHQLPNLMKFIYLGKQTGNLHKYVYNFSKNNKVRIKN